MPKYKRILHISLLTLLLFVIGTKNRCFAEVINSIAARIDGHIITLKDLEIEHKIQKKLGYNSKTREDILKEMIDYYLVLCEIKKVPQKKLKEEFELKIKNDNSKFEALFQDDEYRNFLADIEITRDDILLRFKNRVQIDNFLKQKIKTKKNGSNNNGNMVLEEDSSGSLFLKAEGYIKKLRNRTNRIMINDIIEK
jgi:hypothetical protein